MVRESGKGRKDKKGSADLDRAASSGPRGSKKNISPWPAEEGQEERAFSSQLVSKMELVFAFAEFAAELEHEVALQPDDVVLVCDKHENGWWQGVVVWKGEDSKAYDDTARHRDLFNKVASEVEGDPNPFNEEMVKRAAGLVQKGLSYQQAKVVINSLHWIHLEIAEGGALKEESQSRKKTSGRRRSSDAGPPPRHEMDYTEGGSAQNLPARPMSAKRRPGAGGGGGRERPRSAVSFHDGSAPGEDEDDDVLFEDASPSRPVSTGGGSVRFSSQQAAGGDESRPVTRGSEMFETYAPGVGSTIVTFQGNVVSCFALPLDSGVYVGETMRARPGLDNLDQSLDYPLESSDPWHGDPPVQPHGLGMILYKVEDEQTRTRFRGTFEKGEMTGLGMMEWQDGAKYCGTWKRSLPHGYGEERYPDGSVYQGQLRKDLRHGMGVMMQPNGGGNPDHFSICSGEWRQGMQHGVAIDTLEDMSKNLVSPMMFSLYRKGEVVQTIGGEDADVTALQNAVLIARQRGTEAKARALETALLVMEMTKAFEID